MTFLSQRVLLDGAARGLVGDCGASTAPHSFQDILADHLCYCLLHHFLTTHLGALHGKGAYLILVCASPLVHLPNQNLGFLKNII